MSIVDVFKNHQRQKQLQNNFQKEYQNFVKISQSYPKRFDMPWEKRNPQLLDKAQTTVFDPHYVYFTAWAMRIIIKIKPSKHIDISSNLFFSTLLSAIIKTDFYDYRPVNINLSNLKCKKANLIKLPFKNRSIKSLSCMHVVEHIGLGRYGDAIDPEGDLKSIRELTRVLAKKGQLLFVVPVGKPIIQFNAHRIYSYRQIKKYFSDLKLKEFSLIPDDYSRGIIKNAPAKLANKQNYACGCFYFKKP